MTDYRGNMQPGSASGLSDEWVDVSHGIGIPFGGIGTGYCVYGRHGLVNVNFDSAPDLEQSKQYPGGDLWRYDRVPDENQDFAIAISENGKRLLLQENRPIWLRDVECAVNVKAYALMPKGLFTFEAPGWDLGISVTAFSPMIPHDIENSSIPVVMFDISVTNNSSNRREIDLSFVRNSQPSITGSVSISPCGSGEIGLTCIGSDMEKDASSVSLRPGPGATERARFCLAWYFPEFTYSSESMPDTYRRYYTTRFRSVEDVLVAAVENADMWANAIDKWHESYDVPAYFKRLWFSSLASVITSTMMSDDPYFFEIETPHACINTMDVCVYSSWLYLVNWPVLEEMDIRQYLKVVPEKGPDKGHVWHSLWNEGADYMEESIFPGRVYRDLLWMNEKSLLASAFDKCLMAVKRAYANDNMDYLIVSKRGNQSYDGWMMPGVSAFVNSAWLFSLYALEAIGKILGRCESIAGIPLGEFRDKAEAAYDALLWNNETGCWNCFCRTPGAASGGVQNSLFIDQLFGKWMLSIDHGSIAVLPPGKVKSALNAVYSNNMLYGTEHGFRGWANGMLPGRMPDVDSGIHARTCWIGAQLDMGSLLGQIGDEEKSLGVFQSLESGLNNNHLAVGEWNKAVNVNHEAALLSEEPGKDTPRFPPYPRYKSSWEYLVRILGLEMDWEFFYFQPFKTIDFALKNVVLAGADFNVRVENGWTRVRVNGRNAKLPLRIRRGDDEYSIEFIRADKHAS